MTDTTVKLPTPAWHERRCYVLQERIGSDDSFALMPLWTEEQMQAYATAAALASHPKLMEVAEKAQAVVDSDGGKFMDFLANVADLRTALKGLRGEGK